MTAILVGWVALGLGFVGGWIARGWIDRMVLGDLAREARRHEPSDAIGPRGTRRTVEEIEALWMSRL